MKFPDFSARKNLTTKKTAGGFGGTENLPSQGRNDCKSKGKIVIVLQFGIED